MINEESIQKFRSVCDNIFTQIRRDVIGQDEVVEVTVIAMIAGGNVLLEGVPGLGKTRLVRTLSSVFDLPFSRIQFTPDLLPSDVVGVTYYDQKRGEFEYREGPIFASIVLADEINRASPKTQSALLEVMEEQKVTVDGVTHDVPQPFIVIATQNPTGSAGTTMLPNSQLDRFLIKISMGYPDLESQISILQERHSENPLDKVRPVLDKAGLQALIDETTAVHVAQPVYAYVAQLAQATRAHPAVQLGLSPRGALAVCRMAKACAFLSGRDYVVPEDVAAIFSDVAAHRLMLNAKARMMELDAQQLAGEILKNVPMPAVRSGGK